jgi:hypothetical protein
MAASLRSFPIVAASSEKGEDYLRDDGVEAAGVASPQPIFITAHRRGELRIRAQAFMRFGISYRSSPD